MADQGTPHVDTVISKEGFSDEEAFEERLDRGEGVGAHGRLMRAVRAAGQQAEAEGSRGRVAGG